MVNTCLESIFSSNPKYRSCRFSPANIPPPLSLPISHSYKKPDIYNSWTQWNRENSVVNVRMYRLYNSQNLHPWLYILIRHDFIVDTFYSLYSFKEETPQQHIHHRLHIWSMLIYLLAKSLHQRSTVPPMTPL